MNNDAEFFMTKVYVCFSVLFAAFGLIVLLSTTYDLLKKGNKIIHSLVFSLRERGWQEPEPSHVTGMALANCILDRFLWVVCHCFPPPLDVPTFAARCLYVRNDARDPSS